MTARTVTGTVEFPVGDGAPLVGARVAATLHTGVDAEVAYGSSGDVAVSGSATLTDNTGSWALQLEPNANITPAGTVWRVTITAPGGRSPLVDTYIEVPDTAGTLEFTGLLAEQPGALPSQALAAHTAEINAHGSSVFDPRDFGTLSASGDNRAAFQAAIDAIAAAAGGTLNVPPGSWPIGKGAGAYCLAACSDLTVTGPGTLVQAAGVESSVRMFHLDGVTRFAALGLSLDGNKAAQSVNEHRHGFFITDSSGVRIEGCDIYGFTGDGVYLFNGADDVSISGNVIHDCGRNGISIGPSSGAVNRCMVTRNRIFDCASTAVDHEPTGGYAVDTVISDNSLDCPHAVSFSGTLGVAQSSRCVIQGNVCVGLMTFAWGDRLVIVGNRVAAPASPDGPLLKLNYLCTNVQVASNLLTASADVPDAALYVAASGGDVPSNIVVSNNAIRVDGQAGCLIHGAESASVTGNLIEFDSVSGSSIGVHVKPTAQMESVVVSSNTIVAASTPILFEPSSTRTVKLASVHGNVLDDRGESVAAGVVFLGSSQFVDRAYIAGNLVGAAVGTAVSGTSNIGELI